MGQEVDQVIMAHKSIVVDIGIAMQVSGSCREKPSSALLNLGLHLHL
jgi:hypothetical protein